MEWIIILILALLVVNGIGATLMNKSAVLKGYGEDSHIWTICFFLGIFGYLYVIALPDKITQSQNQQIIELLQEKER